jgi:hypothetical protein
LPQSSLIDLLLLAMFKTNQPKETMTKQYKDLNRFINATQFKQTPIKETIKKTKAKKGVFFKNKKIAKNAEDLFTKMLTQ